MAKIELEEMCPCSSGKLYRDCHLAVRRDQQPGVKVKKRYSLTVIDPPEPGSRTVFEMTQPTVAFSGAEVGIAFMCGYCSFDLIVGVPASSIANVVIRCGKCKRYNEVGGRPRGL
jgi:hypothetical protein